MKRFALSFLSIVPYALILLATLRFAWAANCEGTVAACFAYGPTNGGTDPGPYPGYCCQKKTRGFLLGPDEYGFCRDQKNTLRPQCGHLNEQYYDSDMGTYHCGTVISPYGCGGLAGVAGGCTVVPCGNE